MKLILQIALGVFLGSIASHGTLQIWLDHQSAMAKQSEEKYRADHEKIRQEQAEKIRAMILEQQSQHHSSGNPPPVFVPDDAR